MTDADRYDYAAAAARLREGAVAIFPTETLVGIGCDPHDLAAVARIDRLKGRPPGQPYPLLIADIAAADRLALLPDVARRLAERFWPGLLTLVVPARPGLPPAWTAEDGTIALRASGHPVAAALVRALDGPLVATSANPSGAPPPTRLDQVDPALRAAVDLVLPEPRSAVAGAGSTIVRVAPDRSGADALAVVREGAVPFAALLAAVEEPT